MTATKRILIVDDDRETCRLIAELIGAPGRIIADIPIALARPRSLDTFTSSAFMHLKKQCLELIRQETMRTFQSVPGGHG